MVRSHDVHSASELIATRTAWIKDLFRSPLAQDPYIGPELIKCLDCFLKMRSLALAPHEVSGVSQDEFELDQMDYNDPALCAMLGIETTNETVSAIHKSDAAFAELAHTELSLGLFRLLTSAYAKETAKSRAAPVVNARLNVSFVDDLVACWARCAVVIVRSGKRVRSLALLCWLCRPQCRTDVARVR